MAFLVATFIVFVVSERAIKAKQSQFIAGVGATNFWLSTFLWDALCFLIPSLLIIIVILAAQSTAYSTRELIGYVSAICILFACLVFLSSFFVSANQQLKRTNALLAYCYACTRQLEAVK
jgi:ABC-2 family transporter protein